MFGTSCCHTLSQSTCIRKSMVRRTLILLIVCLWGLPLAISASGTETSETFAKAVVVPQISDRIVLDGRLDEVEWRGAVSITDFQQFSPGNGEPPQNRPNSYLRSMTIIFTSAFVLRILIRPVLSARSSFRDRLSGTTIMRKSCSILSMIDGQVIFFS